MRKHHLITPAPPKPPDAEEDESPDVWGFADTHFQISKNGHVTLSGSRYELSGKELPRFLPWAAEVLDSKVDRKEVNEPNYQSIHYLVRLTARRAGLPEYQRFATSITEVQVRTILQHAWAEIEHDIQYKSSSVIPMAIHRRFMALAGMLEIADREFQGIQDDDRRLTAEARSRIEVGQLQRVEITPDALKAFLDRRLGQDGRISEFSYDGTARLVRKLGFRTLEQVEKCIEGFDDDRLSRVAAGSRLGQTTRFEHMLLAGMGEDFIRRHLWATESWFAGQQRTILDRRRASGIEIHSYLPTPEGPEPSAAPQAAAERSHEASSDS